MPELRFLLSISRFFFPLIGKHHRRKMVIEHICFIVTCAWSTIIGIYFYNVWIILIHDWSKREAIVGFPLSNCKSFFEMELFTRIIGFLGREPVKVECLIFCERNEILYSTLPEVLPLKVYHRVSWLQNWKFECLTVCETIKSSNATRTQPKVQDCISHVLNPLFSAFWMSRNLRSIGF